VGYSPVYDEPSLRGKSRDELMQLSCDLSVRVVHLEQMLEQAQGPSPAQAELARTTKALDETKLAESAALLVEFESELKAASEQFAEAEKEVAAKDTRIAELEAALAAAQTTPAPEPSPAQGAESEPQDPPTPKGKARGK
jgi:chromosome segregation ATPase